MPWEPKTLEQEMMLTEEDIKGLIEEALKDRGISVNRVSLAAVPKYKDGDLFGYEITAKVYQQLVLKPKKVKTDSSYHGRDQ